tara:strand:- start:89 stop:937 length:849 start_codon:yes stop_codon:yes gene_type:complete
MKEQFQHKLTTSFFLWFDNFLLTKGEAFSNKTGDFFYYSDDRLDATYKAYGSPYKQWVTDSSITGATVPSGVYIGGNFSGRDDGVVLDFDNGRALVSGSSTDLTITGSFAVKDFNVYMTNDTEEDLVVENKYTVNSRLPSAPYNYISPYDDVVPAVFIASSDSRNSPFALGGMQDTQVTMKAVVLAEDPYQLDGVLSIFMDSAEECINPIPMTGYPTTELGDLKNNTYNYVNKRNEYSDEIKFYINGVTTSRLSDRDRKSLAHDLYVGFIDFDVQQHRYRFN